MSRGVCYLQVVRTPGVGEGEGNGWRGSEAVELSRLGS